MNETERIISAALALEPNNAEAETSTHDITRNGKRYIIEWNPDHGTISITEAKHCACDNGESCNDCETGEAYDYTDNSVVEEERDEHRKICQPDQVD